ncbi:hypothetical protein L249_6104 [Ophiocordyceps polyrhachis-furcata BCC 54312]|uniref:Uncharacterized protein n=1 Tax=Ophiocordyceps polyrhachis-furcata BCC 54312 TaxID=1330021 RepID=A0A367LJL8_9HYPO|nr:hypothetical protein L249_6104 [Ophiocordyceps polyrhachis-furcata BCC 54312]
MDRSMELGVFIRGTSAQTAPTPSSPLAPGRGVGAVPGAVSGANGGAINVFFPSAVGPMVGTPLAGATAGRTRLQVRCADAASCNQEFNNALVEFDGRTWSSRGGPVSYDCQLSATPTAPTQCRIGTGGTLSTVPNRVFPVQLSAAAGGGVVAPGLGGGTRGGVGVAPPGLTTPPQPGVGGTRPIGGGGGGGGGVNPPATVRPTPPLGGVGGGGAETGAGFGADDDPDDILLGGSSRRGAASSCRPPPSVSLVLAAVGLVLAVYEPGLR